MHKKILTVVGIAFLFLVTCITSSVAIDNPIKPISSGNTLYVGGTGPSNYSKIQDAIDNASDGDTVFVYDDLSPYYGMLIIDKSIDLIGEDRNSTIIDGKGTWNVINITANDVTITNFTIRNSKYNSFFPTYFGILFYECKNFTVINNIFSATQIGIGAIRGNNGLINGNIINGPYNSEGIKLDGTSDTKICNNYITKHEWEGILLSAASKYPENITIIENSLITNFQGIYIATKNSIVQSNYLYNNKDGITISGYHNKAINNTVKNTIPVVKHPRYMTVFNGITIFGSSHNITKNYVYKYCVGMGLYGEGNNIISHNYITKCKCGIQIDESHNNKIFRNNIIKNRGFPWHQYDPNYGGILLFNYANNNSIYQNNFIMNSFQATFLGAPNNNWNENYWNRPRLTQKIILGRKETFFFILPVYIVPDFNFDRNPALLPYKI